MAAPSAPRVLPRAASDGRQIAFRRRPGAFVACLRRARLRGAASIDSGTHRNIRLMAACHRGAEPLAKRLSSQRPLTPAASILAAINRRRGAGEKIIAAFMINSYRRAERAMRSKCSPSPVLLKPRDPRPSSSRQNRGSRSSLITQGVAQRAGMEIVA